MSIPKYFSLYMMRLIIFLIKNSEFQTFVYYNSFYNCISKLFLYSNSCRNLDEHSYTWLLPTKAQVTCFLNDGFLFPMERLLKINTAPTISRHLTYMFRNTQYFMSEKTIKEKKFSSRQSCDSNHFTWTPIKSHRQTVHTHIIHHIMWHLIKVYIAAKRIFHQK